MTPNPPDSVYILRTEFCTALGGSVYDLKGSDAAFNRVGQVAEMTRLCGMKIQRVVTDSDQSGSQGEQLGFSRLYP